MLFNMLSQVKAVLTHKTLSDFSLSAFKRLDDVHVIDNGLIHPTAIADGLHTNRPHVDEQVLSDPVEQFAMT
jgi:hypothetical protein